MCSGPACEVLMDFQEDAAALIGQLTNNLACRSSLGTMSTTVYDTAWVSMVSKVVDDKSEWLFPECFQVILNNQLDHGGWEAHTTVKSHMYS